MVVVNSKPASVSLCRTWLISVAGVIVFMLIGGALAGPFGGVVMVIGVALLTLPLAAVTVATVFIDRQRRPLKSVLMQLGWLCFGWVVALLAAAMLGAVVAGVPLNATSDLTPFWTWVALLGPFVVVGAILATVLHLVRRRGAARGSRDLSVHQR